MHARRFVAVGVVTAAVVPVAACGDSSGSNRPTADPAALRDVAGAPAASGVDHFDAVIAVACGQAPAVAVRDVGPGSKIHRLRSSMDWAGMVICRAPGRPEPEDLKARVQDELVTSVVPKG